MIKWVLRIGGVLVLAIAALFWWLIIGFSGTSGTDASKTEIEQWRSLAGSMQGDLPISIQLLEVGSDRAPSFAAQAGRFSAPVEMSYNALKLNFPSSHIIVGGAVDRLTAEGMTTTPEHWVFSDEAYVDLTETMLAADQVLMTHEHLDHIMAIARHPSADVLAPKLVLNAPQIEALPKFANARGLSPALKTLSPRLSGDLQAVAPGVVVIPAPGHTPGSQMIFVTLQDGSELLLIGDIVWNMGSIDHQKIRPVLTQYLVFRPDFEDRSAIKAQVRALGDLRKSEPGLTILPSHDRAWLKAKAEEGKIVWDQP